MDFITLIVDSSSASVIHSIVFTHLKVFNSVPCMIENKNVPGTNDGKAWYMIYFKTGNNYKVSFQ